MKNTQLSLLPSFVFHNKFIMKYVGVKFPSQQWALGLARSPAMTKREKGDQETSSPTLLGPTYLKDVRGGMSPRTHQIRAQCAPHPQ